MRGASFVLAIIAGMNVSACDDRPDQWDAFIYPGDDLLTHEEIRGFKTFDLCQAAAQERLRASRPDGGGDYECGYKCEASGSGVNICEETRK